MVIAVRVKSGQNWPFRWYFLNLVTLFLAFFLKEKCTGDCCSGFNKTVQNISMQDLLLAIVEKYELVFRV